jgi:hypothetical protein
LSNERFFEPWVGARYGRGLFDIPILVVGESHYDWGGREVDVPNTSEVTRYVVGCWVAGERKRFSTVTTTIFIGRNPSPGEVAEFWGSVAFYNFVQSWVGDAARIRPEDSQWEGNEESFRAVLSELEPKVVVVLGNQNWNNLPSFDDLGDHEPISAGSVSSDAGYYATGPKTRALAVQTRHPSSGLDGRNWTPLIRKAIAEARSER